MSDGSGEHFAHLPKTKRSRRKKHQKNYQDMHKDQMIQQLGRRFHNKPSTSSCSPTNVGEIPLPPEAPNTFGAPPPLTEEDYQVNYMVDPEVVSSRSAELIRSYREVVKADEAELYMLVIELFILFQLNNSCVSESVAIVKAFTELGSSSSSLGYCTIVLST